MIRKLARRAAVALVTVLALLPAALVAIPAQSQPVNNGGAVYQKVCVHNWTGEPRWRLNPLAGCEVLTQPPGVPTGTRWIERWVVVVDGMGCGQGTRPEFRVDDGRGEDSCLAPITGG